MATKKSAQTGSKRTTKSTRVSSRSSQTAKTKAVLQSNAWNLCLAVVFVLQAIAVLVFSHNANVPVVTHYLTTDSLASQAAGHTILSSAVRKLFDVNIGYLVAAFLFLSAIIHGLMASLWRKEYEKDLKQRVNKIRWFDYGLSGGLALIVVALLNGMYDISSLFMLFILVVFVCGLALFGESHTTTPGGKMRTYVAVLVAGISAWLTIGLYVAGAIIHGTGLGHYVYVIDAVIGLVSLGIVGNLYLVLRAQKRWTDYLFGERVFMLLSFAAKTALAWLIFADLLK